MSNASHVLRSFNTQLPALKADSDAIVDTIGVKRSRATIKSTEKFFLSFSIKLIYQFFFCLFLSKKVCKMGIQVFI